MPRPIDCVLESPDRTTYRTPRIDASTHCLQIIDYAHHEAHDGRAFKLEARSDNLGTSPIHFHFTTPAKAASSRRIHITMKANAGGEAEFIALEDATGITGGAPVSPLNRRRDSLNLSIVDGACFIGGTAPTGGDEIEGHYLGQDALGNTSFGGEGRSEEEIVLKPNSVYSFRLAGITGVRGNLHLNWYEHSDKEIIDNLA